MHHRLSGQHRGCERGPSMPSAPLAAPPAPLLVLVPVLFLPRTAPHAEVASKHMVDQGQVHCTADMRIEMSLANAPDIHAGAALLSSISVAMPQCHCIRQAQCTLSVAWLVDSHPLRHDSDIWRSNALWYGEAGNE